MAVDIHLFHGFLGNISDWDQVKVCLNSDYKVVTHNLIEDYAQLSEVSFDNWKSLKEKQLANDSTKILVGYSLGGRLALHLDDDCFDKMILIGSHPGLEENISERLKSDQEWIEKGHKMTQEEWLSQWNAQKVFENDQVRPERSMSSEEFLVWLDIMGKFSLAKQQNFFENPFDNIFWGYGEKDKKFSLLKPKVENWIDKNNIFEVPNSGHGVIFDNPQFVASIINEVCSDIA